MSNSDCLFQGETTLRALWCLLASVVSWQECSIDHSVIGSSNMLGWHSFGSASTVDILIHTCPCPRKSWLPKEKTFATPVKPRRPRGFIQGVQEVLHGKTSHRIDRFSITTKRIREALHSEVGGSAQCLLLPLRNCAIRMLRSKIRSSRVVAARAYSHALSCFKCRGQ